MTILSLTERSKYAIELDRNILSPILISYSSNPIQINTWCNKIEQITNTKKGFCKNSFEWQNLDAINPEHLKHTLDCGKSYESICSVYFKYKNSNIAELFSLVIETFNHTNFLNAFAKPSLKWLRF